MAKKKSETETPLESLPDLPSIATLENNLDQLMLGAMDPSSMPACFDGDDPTGFFLKNMFFGTSGSGKSFALVALLLAGERLFIVSSDPGGDGLLTVQNELIRLGRRDLLKAYKKVNVPSYKVALALWTDPYRWYKAPLDALDPTVVVWEGFSYLQTQGIDEEVMPDDLRASKDEGVDPYVFWDKVRRATIRIHDKFLNSHGRAADGSQKLWHHILTCHQTDPKEDKVSGIIKTKAQIQGQAFKAVQGAYDLVLQMYVRQGLMLGADESPYRYRCVGGSDEFEVKSRGFDLGFDENGETAADFAKVWEAEKKVLRAIQEGE